MIKPAKKLEPLNKENEELIAIASKSIETAKTNKQKVKNNASIFLLLNIDYCVLNI